MNTQIFQSTQKHGKKWFESIDEFEINLQASLITFTV